jgi:hypothetical protein
MRIEIFDKWLTTEEIEELRVHLNSFFMTDLDVSVEGNMVKFKDEEMN